MPQTFNRHPACLPTDVKEERPSLLAANVAALYRRYPELAGRLDVLRGRESLCVFKAHDGGIAYGWREDGRVVPLTDPLTPLARMQAQLDRSAAQLADFSRPVLIAGLYPGNELLAVFDAAERNAPPHAEQRIWVCVDSLPCLLGFLTTWDARRVIEATRVHFFWHEETESMLRKLEENPEEPDLFTLLSGAPDGLLARLTPPFAGLSVRRQRETERIKAENNAYYDAIGDAELALIVSGQAGRKPRLLMPTCAGSTFVRHSARDTCAAFRELGWETQILCVEGMLTEHCLAHRIHEFKPDVLLFIDHLRGEAEQAYPRNLLFVTWVQDQMTHIRNSGAGAALASPARARRRDLIAGYVTDDYARLWGYPPERMLRLRIPADPLVFYPVRPLPETASAYTCDLAYMSNVSTTTEAAVERQVAPRALALGLTRADLGDIHDRLWAHARAGRWLNDRSEFLRELHHAPTFAAVYASLPADDAEALLDLLYWRLNDVICRHAVLEWADEAGLDLRLYGQGWRAHPRFAKYARDPLEHGEELNLAYQAARVNLHLNITSGLHQRLLEILAADAVPLFRTNAAAPEDSRLDRDMRAFLRRLSGGSNTCAPMPAARLAQLCANVMPWLLNEATRRSDPPAECAGALLELFRTRCHSHMPWLIGGLQWISFQDRDSFLARATALLANPRRRARVTQLNRGASRLTYAHVARDLVAGIRSMLTSGGIPSEAAAFGAACREAGLDLPELAGRAALIGLCMDRRDDMAGALDAFAGHWRAGRISRRGAIRYVALLTAAGRLDEARERIAEWYTCRPGDVDFASAAGGVLLAAAGRVSDAAALMELDRGRGVQGVVWTLREAALLAESGHWEQGRALVAEVERREPPSPGRMTFVASGLLLCALRECPAADRYGYASEPLAQCRALLEDEIARESPGPGTYVLLARVFAIANEPDRAAQTLAAGRSRFGATSCPGVLPAIELWAAGQTARAREFLAPSSLGAEQTDWTALFYGGVAMSLTGQPERAAEAFRLLHRLRPLFLTEEGNDARWFFMAMISRLLRRRDDADRCMAHARACDRLLDRRMPLLAALPANPPPPEEWPRFRLPFSCEGFIP